MSNTFGTNLKFTLFGESHGPVIGAVLDGLPAGLKVSREVIDRQLSLRRPAGTISTGRVEPDDWSIDSGLYRGYTCGTPLVLTIRNRQAHSSEYDETLVTPRPAHADYSAFVKYHGFADPRGGGMFSGRLTAPIVACGAIVLEALRAKGILLGTHIASIVSVADRPFASDEAGLAADLSQMQNEAFPVLDAEKCQQMREVIENARQNQDSVGGTLETAVIGLPAGIGEPWFDSLESRISAALFSIPAVKGVEFGDGFAMSQGFGSTMNDAWCFENNQVRTITNHNGGINGGISNGMPLRWRCAIKPTPSIGQEQQSIDLKTGQPAALAIRGRHDPCIVHRAAVVVNCLSALVLADLAMQEAGRDFLLTKEDD